MTRAPAHQASILSDYEECGFDLVAQVVREAYVLTAYLVKLVAEACAEIKSLKPATLRAAS